MNSLERYYKHCSNNRHELSLSEQCGCFCCLTLFAATEVDEWVEGNTAICPYCSVDAVIGDNSGMALTTELLASMKDYWFGQRVL